MNVLLDVWDKLRHRFEHSQRPFTGWKLLLSSYGRVNFNLKDAAVEIVEDVERVGVIAGLEEAEDFIHVEGHVVGVGDALR